MVLIFFSVCCVLLLNGYAIADYILQRYTKSIKERSFFKNIRQKASLFNK